VLVTAVAAAAPGTDDPTLPPDAARALRAAYGAFTIVSDSDVNSEECDPREPGGPPRGLVIADFNGDGRTDYAVLVRMGPGKNVEKAAGRAFTLYDAAFVVLLGEPSGGFTRISLWNHDMWIPINLVVGLAAPGVIREHGSAGDRTVELKNPGITVDICGKTTEVLYWNDVKKSFDSVTISD
jgi:hypothetical protein